MTSRVPGSAGPYDFELAQILDRDGNGHDQTCDGADRLTGSIRRTIGSRA